MWWSPAQQPRGKGSDEGQPSLGRRALHRDDDDLLFSGKSRCRYGWFFFVCNSAITKEHLHHHFSFVISNSSVLYTYPTQLLVNARPPLEIRQNLERRRTPPKCYNQCCCWAAWLSPACLERLECSTRVLRAVWSEHVSWNFWIPAVWFDSGAGGIGGAEGTLIGKKSWNVCSCLTKCERFD